jgi:hypothetical protein
LNDHQDKDREDLFPIGQIGVVENQIVDCFNYERSKLLGIKHGEAINMKYVHDISRFREISKTRVPENYEPSDEVFDIVVFKAAIIFGPYYISIIVIICTGDCWWMFIVLVINSSFYVGFQKRQPSFNITGQSFFVFVVSAAIIILLLFLNL